MTILKEKLLPGILKYLRDGRKKEIILEHSKNVSEIFETLGVLENQDEETKNINQNIKNWHKVNYGQFYTG